MAGSQVSTFPDTVTVLNASNGSIVYAVGTSNLSNQSEEVVAQVINAVKPDSVVLQTTENILSSDVFFVNPCLGFGLQLVKKNYHSNDVHQ